MERRGVVTKVKRILDERGIRYIWLANKLGITGAQFTHYEAGHYAKPPQYYERIAAILDVPIEDVRPEAEQLTPASA